MNNNTFSARAACPGGQCDARNAGRWKSGSDALAQQASEPAASSDTQLEQVVVTATKRGNEDLQTVLIAITAESQATLKPRVRSAFFRLRPLGAFSPPSTPAPAFKICVGSAASMLRGTGVATVGQQVDDILVTGDLRQPDPAPVRYRSASRCCVTAGHLYGSGSLSGTIRTITNQPDTTGYHVDTIVRTSNTEYGGENYNGAVDVQHPDQRQDGVSRHRV